MHGKQPCFSVRIIRPWRRIFSVALMSAVNVWSSEIAWVETACVWCMIVLSGCEGLLRERGGFPTWALQTWQVVEFAPRAWGFPYRTPEQELAV